MRSFAPLVVAVAFAGWAIPGEADVYEPPTENLTPVNQEEFGVHIWVHAGISRCAPAEDVWVRVPKAVADHPFRDLSLRVLSEDGETQFLALLAVRYEPPGGTIVGGIPDHPLRDPAGFHGSVFCLQRADLQRAELLLDFGEPSKPTAILLRAFNLKQWLQ